MGLRLSQLGRRACPGLLAQLACYTAIVAAIGLASARLELRPTGRRSGDPCMSDKAQTRRNSNAGAATSAAPSRRRNMTAMLGGAVSGRASGAHRGRAAKDHGPGATGFKGKRTVKYQRAAGSRVCGKCTNQTATFGVVGRDGAGDSTSKGWTLFLCRLCARSVASSDRNCERVLRLAGRCAHCRMFAIYGISQGPRRHCRSDLQHFLVRRNMKSTCLNAVRVMRLHGCTKFDGLVRAHTHTHTCTHAQKHTQTYTQTLANTHTRTPHSHKHTHIHTHTHTQTHMCAHTNNTHIHASSLYLSLSVSLFLSLSFSLSVCLSH